MSDLTPESGPTPSQPVQLQLGAQIEMEDYGYSFRPITGFELEIDESVYMYSEDVSVEINLIGGKLEDETSIAELNNQLASEFLSDVDHFVLFEAGTDIIQGITGFINDIHYANLDEEGFGRALICAPYINQYFFILVTASHGDWESLGEVIFQSLKQWVRFHPQFKPVISEGKTATHPDLTIETFQDIPPDEDLLVTIEKMDASLLLSAQSYQPDDQVWLTGVTDPDGNEIYRYDPQTGRFLSQISSQPIQGDHGEACIFFPQSSKTSLRAGMYRVEFATQSGLALQEVRIVIRSSRALGIQKFDLNFWIASNDSDFYDPEFLEQFGSQVTQALKEQLLPHNLAPGEITFFQPAPEELMTFSTLDLQRDLADCSYMVAETVNNHRALNIALVDKLTEGEVEAQVSAVSCGSPGMILSPGSPHACVVINWQAFKQQVEKFAGTMIEQLLIFSGVAGPQDDQPIALNRDLAWHLRRHPLFYDAT
jgi:hypothetical protein